MKHLLSILILTLAVQLHANAVEFLAYRATASIPAVNSSFENDRDQFVSTRLSTKQIINLSTGQPLKTKTPKNLKLVLLVPKDGGAPQTSRLCVLNTETSAIIRVIASVTNLTLFRPDDPNSSGAGIGSVSVAMLSNSDLTFDAFSLAGSGTGFSKEVKGVPVLKLKVGGLHGEITRQPTFTYYAGVVLKASLRASGKPIATLDL